MSANSLTNTSPTAYLGESPQPGSWGEAALAALPHLITALWIGLLWILSASGITPPTIQTTYGVFFGVTDLIFGGIILSALVLILAAGWSKSWRLWPASWYGYGIALAFVLLIQPFQAWRSSSSGLLSGAFTGILAPLALGGLLLWLARRSPLKAILVALPLATMLWITVLEFVPSGVRGAVLLGAWLLTALVAAAIVRRGSIPAGALLAAGINLLIGLTFSLARASFLAGPGPNGGTEVTAIPLDPAQFAYYFTPSLLALSTLVLGPVLAAWLGEIGKEESRRWRWSYPLAILGLALALAGNLASFWWVNSYIRKLFNEASQNPAWPYFSWIVFGGLLLFLAGALAYTLPVRQRPGSTGLILVLLLALFLFSLPFTAAAPLAFGNRFELPGLPFPFYDLDNFQKALSTALALGWLALGGWLSSQIKHEPTRAS